MHTKIKKYLSFVLVFAILFSNLSTINVFAGDEDEDLLEFKIKGVASTVFGDNDHNREAVSIELSYFGPQTLYEVMKGVTKVVVDEKNVPLADKHGRPTFILLDSNYLAFSDKDSPEGIALVEDFKKRTAHMVEISFSDGTVLKYQDSDYEPRTDLDDTPEVPGPGDGGSDTPDPGTDDEGDETIEGINKQYVIKDVIKADSYGTLTLYFLFERDLPWGDTGHKKVKSLTLNGVKFEGKDVSNGNYSGGGSYVTGWKMDTDAAIKAFDLKSAAEVRVVFDDKSVSKFVAKEKEVTDLEYTVKYYKDDIEFASVKGTVKSNAAQISSITDLEDKKPEGYKLDVANSSRFPFTVSDSNNIITIKYVRIEQVKDLPYTIKYYKGSEEFAVVEKTVKSNAATIQSINDIENKTPDGYELDKENSTQFPFTVSETNKEIIIKYVEKEKDPNAKTIAEDFVIQKVLNYSTFGPQKVYIIFERDLDYTGNDYKKVKSLFINEIDYKANLGTGFYNPDRYKTSFVVDNRDAVNLIADETVQKVIRIVFTDDSESTFTIEAKAPQSPFENLKNGEYTLTYKMNVDGKQEESMLAGFFDKRAKLVVKDGVNTVSLLNHSSADGILDFAIAKEGVFKPMEKKILEEKKGIVRKAEYTAVIDDLSKVQKTAVMGTGPMGGHPSLIGQYDSDKYRKVDLIFTDVKEGFTQYEKIEQEEEQIKNNDQNLTDALIRNNLDTDNDDEISVEELQKAKGKQVVIFFGDKTAKQNVLDLRGAGLVDISRLKDLGPGVKAILLDSGNNIKELPEDVFANATGLEYILLSGNKELSNLPANLFANNKELIYVTADGCDLGDLPKGLFKNNKKIRTIGFQEAGITSVPEDLIHSCTRLEELYLQENSIKTLPANFFDAQKKNLRLREVNLAVNELESVPAGLGELRAVGKVVLHNNKLKEIPASFANFDAITYLDLENNQIENIPTAVYVNLIKKAKSINGGVRLDLSNNNLKTLPVAEMLEALKDGRALTKFEVDKNYLKPVLSEEEREQLASLGVDFVGTVVYLPQKTLFEAKGVAQEGTIELRQRFDILELYYWTLGDAMHELAKKLFTDSDDFEKYLLGNGRAVNDVAKDTPREQAIVEILAKKSSAWRVETQVKKNGQIIFKSTADNKAEGIVQQFEDKKMKKGDKYTIYKVLYVKGVFGYTSQIEYSVDVVATKGVGQEAGVKEIPVKVYRTGTTELSPMGSQAIKTTASYEKRDGKHIYTIYNKPLDGVSLTSIEVNGKTILPQAAVGEYNQSFTFELTERRERVTFKMSAPGMPMKPSADLVFDFTGVSDEDNSGAQDNAKEIPVKAYKVGTQEPSKVAEAIKPTALYEEKNGKHNYTLSFRPIQVGDRKASVDTIEVNGVTIQPEVADGEYDKTFTFELDQRQEKLTIKTKVSVMMHSPQVDLVFDYSGLSGGNQGQNPGTPQEPGNNDNQGGQPQVPTDEYNLENGVQYRVNVSLLNYHSNEISMGDKAFENNRSAYVTRMGSQYKIEITSNPIQMGEAQAGIERLVSHDDAIANILHETTNLGNLTYASKITLYVNQLKDTYDVGIYAGPMNDTKAKLKFDLANRQKSNDIVDANTGTVPGAGAAPKDEKKEEKKEELKENKVPLSKQNKAIMDVAKVDELVKDFADVTENAWYRESVAFVLDKKLFNGMSKTSFGPNKPMTRGMVVTVLHRLAEEKEVKENVLADVARNMYYAKAFDWAVNEGMIKGYADSTYKPENTITIQEFVSILYRYAKAAAGKEASLDKFTDKTEVAAWAKEAIAWAVEMGIVEGDNAKLNPNKELTRAEATSILKRFILSQNK